MYKLIKSKEGININKFHGELGDLGLLYYLTYNESEFYLIFPDLKREETEVLDENEVVIDTIVSYKKREIQTLAETDEDGNEITKEVEAWVDYDFSIIEGIINDTIANHDPTPTPQPKTELELLREQIAQQQEIIDAMLNGGGN